MDSNFYNALKNHFGKVLQNHIGDPVDQQTIDNIKDTVSNSIKAKNVVRNDNVQYCKCNCGTLMAHRSDVKATQCPTCDNIIVYDFSGIDIDVSMDDGIANVEISSTATKD